MPEDDMGTSEVGASFLVKAPTADENRRRGFGIREEIARARLGWLQAVARATNLFAAAGEHPKCYCSLSCWMRHDVFCRSWGERIATPTVSGPAGANRVGPEMALKPYEDA